MRAAIARLILMAASAGSVGAVAAQPAAPAASCAISVSAVGPLNEAREAKVAGDIDVEIDALLKAQAASGRKTEYEKFLIDSWLATAYMLERDLAKAEPLLVAAARSPCASSAQRKEFTETAMGILKGSSGRASR